MQISMPAWENKIFFFFNLFFFSFSDVRLHSYEDKPYLFLPLIYSGRLTAKIDFFEDTACKITFALTSPFSICSESSHSPKKGLMEALLQTL